MGKPEEKLNKDLIPTPKKHGKVGETMEEFDDLLDFVGSHGRYQKLVLYGALVPISFILALLSFTVIFTLFIPDHHCSPREEPGQRLGNEEMEKWKLENIPRELGLDGVEQFSSCSMYNTTAAEPNVTMECQHGWSFSTQDFENTIATDNIWVCQKDFYPTQVFTITSIGCFVGNVVFGPLSDKFGRRPILFISLFLYMIFVTGSFFVTHIFPLYLTMSFVAAMGFPMVYTLPPLLMAELCDNEYRAWTYTVSWVAWVFGMAAVPLIAFLSRTWFVLSIGITSPGFLIFLLFPILPESPRWLVTMGRVNDAAKILRQVTKINGTIDKISDRELVTVLQKLVDLEKERKVLGFWTLFSTKRLVMITSLIGLLWSTNMMIYEQITLNTPYMSGNQFLNFFILAIVELPGSVLAGYMVGKLGRRWTPVIFGLVMAIVSLVAGGAPQDLKNLVIICIILSKFCVTVTMYVVYVQGTELFPTPLRVTGSAVCSTIASIFGLLSPTVVYTAKFYSGAPYLFMSMLALIGALATSFLPETLRQHLPETIEDADDFGRGNKFWSIHPDYDRKRRKSIRRASLLTAPATLSPTLSMDKEVTTNV